MPRLMRVHFASIGHRDARLSPLTLDLRADGGGSGVDSVLWLRNGGGKSSILNLFFSALRPRVRDFLGAAAEGKSRRLADYVKEGDLACVVGEWDLAPRLDELRRPPSRVCLIGQVLSWKGLQRSTDESRLRRLFFSLRAGPGLRFDDLPIDGLGAPAGSFEAFREWLAGQKSARPELEVLYTDALQRWEDHLTSLGVDPELMRVQIQMNLREGAADELFRFASPRDFINFFLELAMDFERASELSANLDALRGQLQRRPSLLRERELFDAVLPALEGLAAAVAEERDAAQGLNEAIERAAGTAGGIRQRLVEFAEHRDERLAAAAEASEQMRLASNEADSRRRWATGLDRRAVQLAVDEAEAAKKSADEGQRAAERQVAVVAAADHLAALRGLDGQIVAKQEALERANAELAPLRAELDVAGARLRAHLRRRDAALVDEAEAAEAAHAHARSEEARRQDERVDAGARQARIDHELKTLRESLAARDRAREALSREHLLESYEEARSAQERWRSRQSEAEARRDQAAAEAERHRGERDAVSESLRELAAERASADAERKEQTRVVEEARRWQRLLRSNAAICGLQGVEEADLEQPRLPALLREQAEAARRQHLARSVDAAEDQRSLAVLERDELLPPARDVEVVLRALETRKIPAHAGLRYLAENAAGTEAEELLAADPRRFSGVVVMRGEDVAAARSLRADDLRLRGPVHVAVAGLPTVPVVDPEGCVVPPDAALYDRVAAGERRRELLHAQQQRDRDLDALRRQEEVHRAAADELDRFLDAWGRGKLDQRESLIRAVVERIERLDRELELAEARQVELDRAIDRARKESAEAERERQEAGRAVDRVTTFIDTHERHVDGWKRDLDHRQREAELLVLQLDAIAAAITAAAEVTQEAHVRLLTLRRARDDLARELAAVTYHGPEREPDETSEAEARARYDELRELYERRTSENRLQWELEQLHGERQKKQGELDRQLRTLDRADVEAACDRGDLEGQRKAAERELERARKALALAEVEMKVAKEALRERRRRREADDLPPDRPPPTTSAAAREAAQRCREDALRFAEEQESHRARETEAKGAADRLKRRLVHHQSGLDLLLAVAVELPERPPRPLPDDDATLDRTLKELQEALRSRRARAAERREAAHRSAEQVRHIASDDRFTALRSQARERLRGEVHELQERAAEFAAELGRAREILQRDLDELDEHRRILLNNLVEIGENAAFLLRQATRASALPEQLGAWSGRSYLKIELQPPDGESDKRARLEPLIDRLMEQATIPGAVKLVQEALFELAGGRHDAFRVSVLKPDAVLRADPIPIELLSTFSRGQQLTASILLYCTIVQLRARRRGRGGRQSDAGVLILDNPIGTCSSRALLDLQRMIAQRMGVQLIYTTGVEDADAIAVLPNTIRLRNAHRDRRSGDLHVTHEESALDGVRIEARGA